MSGDCGGAEGEGFGDNATSLAEQPRQVQKENVAVAADDGRCAMSDAGTHRPRAVPDNLYADRAGYESACENGDESGDVFLGVHAIVGAVGADEDTEHAAGHVLVIAHADGSHQCRPVGTARDDAAHLP